MDYITKNELVYHSLKEKIIKGDIPGGDKLILAAIAKEYNVSTIPVREAIKQLQQDGLVEATPHNSARVIEHDLDTLKKILEVRLAIEGLLAELSAKNINQTQLMALEDINVKMNECMDENDPINYDNLDKMFHKIIYDSCPNEILHDIYVELRNKSQYARTVFTKNPTRMEVSYKDHIEWVNAIKNKDYEQVKEIAQRHKQGSFEYTFKYIEEKKSKDN